MLPEMNPRTARVRDLPHDDEVMARLRDMCSARGLEALAENLGELMALTGADMADIEAELAQSARGERVAERAGSHLLDLGGKRLRPLCVALASRCGAGFDRSTMQLAVAVELVHNATLLHDDVIDLAPTRRGAPSARAEFGNAASIFAGDWLLIDALRRVRKARVPGTLDALLDTIADMIRAESLQLENRGRLDISRDLYFRVAEGKSATLFRWAMLAGARSGGIGRAGSMALQDFGSGLGIAFQVIDDLLDLDTQLERTGKTPFTDLREGKVTFPVIVALERAPELREVLGRIVATDPPAEPERRWLLEVERVVTETGAADACRRLAADRIEGAIENLSVLPPSAAREALATVGRSTAHRLL